MAQTRRHSDKDKHPSTFFRKVNILIRRLRRGEVGTFLLFVAIAFFFWTVQTARKESAKDFIVKFYVEDQPQDWVFTTHVPQELKVTISDTNSRLSNYQLNNRLDSLGVNFERYADVQGNFRISAAELQSLLMEGLESSTRVVAISPTLIDARFAQTEGRKFPVKVSGTYDVAPNHRMRPFIIEPDSIIINAPAAVLDTMKMVYAVSKGMQNMTDTLEEVLSLELPIGVKATPAKVKVMIPVAQFVEKTMGQVEVQVLNEPGNRHLIIFPYSVDLTCLVDFEHYRDITPEDFLVAVNYDSIQGQDRQGKLPITVRYIGPPEIVTNVQITPKTAEYVVEKR
ncbi:MAG: hypothetical protein J5543_00815 [Bacteroidales bacterium]|jgi:hypothetical protein|nr:hypothetical protein [Bacteroidales bacterium]